MRQIRFACTERLFRTQMRSCPQLRKKFADSKNIQVRSYGGFVFACDGVFDRCGSRILDNSIEVGRSDKRHLLVRLYKLTEVLPRRRVLRPIRQGFERRLRFCKRNVRRRISLPYRKQNSDQKIRRI